MGKAPGRACTGSFVLRVFICFLKARILGEVSGEEHNRIFISFPDVSFNILIHQNEHIRSGSFSGQLPLQRMSPRGRGTGTKVGLPQHGLECVKHLFLIVFG